MNSNKSFSFYLDFFLLFGVSTKKILTQSEEKKWESNHLGRKSDLIQKKIEMS